jgi:hypothetical protein
MSRNDHSWDEASSVMTPFRPHLDLSDDTLLQVGRLGWVHPLWTVPIASTVRVLCDIVCAMPQYLIYSNLLFSFLFLNLKAQFS